MGDSSGSGRLFGNSPTIELTGKIMVIAIIVVFLVVVFFLFLHLYAKWFWWRTEDSTVPSREARRQRRRFVFVPGQDPSLAALRKGLDPSVLRSLPVLVFNPEKFKDGLECAVCLSELAEGDKLRLLPKCNHGFHVDCIDMWFQSHSTCPLCRNPVTSESSNSPIIELSTDVQSPEENLARGYSTESPNFPTNVLFWGNETQVSTRAASLEEASSSSSSLALASSSQEEALVIDIPRQMIDNSSLVSPSGMRFAEEEQKSPMTTRLRSLKRLLSKEKRAVSCSPSCVDVEQAGRSQSSSAVSNVQR